MTAGTTRRDGGRKDDDRPKRPALGSRRNANVWMAPGARPLGEKAAAKAEKNAQTARKRGEKPTVQSRSHRLRRRPSARADQSRPR